MDKKELIFLLFIGVLFSLLLWTAGLNDNYIRKELATIQVNKTVINNSNNYSQIDTTKLNTDRVLLVCWSSIYQGSSELFEELERDTLKYKEYYILVLSPFKEEKMREIEDMNIVWLNDEQDLINELTRQLTNFYSLEIPFIIEINKGKIVQILS
uniref:hypothetical protein n=1 Tax=uncultured Draconibacterium sp. TaxID=1573823 RepID=UPI003216C820